MQPREHYAELARRVKEEALLASCAEVLGWDEETYLPHTSIAHRAEQFALLAGLLHDRATDPRLGDLLAAIEGSELVADPDSAESVNVRELRRLYSRATRLPRSFGRGSPPASPPWLNASGSRPQKRATGLASSPGSRKSWRCKDTTRRPLCARP